MIINTKLCSIAQHKLDKMLVTPANKAAHARACALVRAVDITVTALSKFGWDMHIYNAMPPNTVPWRSVCVYLNDAAVNKPVPGRAWRIDTKEFAKFYETHGFFKIEAASTVGSDQLLYRTLAEEVFLRSRPEIGSNWASADAGNILLIGMLNLP